MVNVILVDFRGFDTFGEIIVLGIAALVIYALTEALLSSAVRARLLNRGYEEERAGDAHPLMMVVLTRVMMPVRADGRRLYLPARPQRTGRRLHRRAGRRPSPW